MPALIDTSAWIEFLRDTGSPACEAVTDSIRTNSAIVCDPVYLELLSGARSHEADALLRLLGEQDYMAVAPRLDWLDGAQIYRQCRAAGLTVRSQVDCLIAAVAIRIDVPIVHHDRDYRAIARLTPLQLVA